MVKSVWAWVLVAVLVAILFWNRGRSFANVRQPPKPDASFYYIHKGESCAEGYDGPLGEALRCKKK